MPPQAEYAAYGYGDNESDIGRPQNDTAPPAVWIRNESAAALLGRRENAWCLHITCEIYDTLSRNWTEEIRHAFTEAVRADGVPTTLSSDWRAGRFQICAAVGNPDPLYAVAADIARQYPQIDAQADCVFDPSWAHYRL